MEKHLSDIDKEIMEHYKNEPRNVMDIIYVNGISGADRIERLVNHFGKEDVYVVDNDSMFDDYACEEMIVFNDFDSSISMYKMLTYLDASPLKLHTKHGDIWACYSWIYIVSDIPLHELYIDFKESEPDLWSDFIHLINKVEIFEDGHRVLCSLEEYWDAYATTKLD